MPNPFLYKWTVLFQTIQFSMHTLFNCQKYSIWTIQFSQTVLIKTIQFSISIDFVYTVKCQNSSISYNSVYRNNSFNVKNSLISNSSFQHQHAVKMSKPFFVFQAILFSISTQFSSIWPIDRTLSGATVPYSQLTVCAKWTYNVHYNRIYKEDRNLGIRKHVTTLCSGTKHFY